MDKKQGIPKGKGLPTIGGTEKAKSEEFARQIMQYLDPIMNNILQSIDGIERRLAVVEEVKQLFPPKVEVIIKQDKPQDISEGVLDMIVNKLEKHGKVTKVSKEEVK